MQHLQDIALKKEGSTMNTQIVAVRRVMAGIVVDDLRTAGAWYETILGRPPDSAPMSGLLEWHLLDDAWLQVVSLHVVRDIQDSAEWGATGASSVSFVVANLGDQLARLAANGIELVSRYSTDSNLETATVRDPAGNFVTFVEEPPTKI